MFVSLYYSNNVFLFVHFQLVKKIQILVKHTSVSCFFTFSRNEVLESSLSELGYKAPSARKTGTTIAGIVYKVQ